MKFSEMRNSLFEVNKGSQHDQYMTQSWSECQPPNMIERVGCKAGSPSWAPPSSEQFPPPWERCLNGLLFVTFCAVPLKFNKYYVIKKLADIFVLSLLASLIHVLERYVTYSFY